MKLKALLIGCGNVGAGYDLDRPGLVWSHAKAYSLNNEIELTVSDIDADKAKKVAAAFNVKFLSEPDRKEYENFHIISVATPTTTHFEYLRDVLTGSSHVVICEKPVVSRMKDADDIANIYKSGSSKVLVNYMRRFQPAYKTAKQKLNNEFHKKALRGIIIKYSRGFLNNASHAVDLLEFLFEEPFDFRGFHIQECEFDAFEHDPTLTGSCHYLNQPVSFSGISNITYPVFEIEIFYVDSKIVICHSGNEIRYYSKNANSLSEDYEKRQVDILEKYMMPVINEAVDLFFKRKTEDNFMPALRINKCMLEIIEPLKKHHVTTSN